ncbi:MAG: 16S rRNA (uracil(1498)-N(3))-methyltransferase [Bacillota bacterium]
MHRFYISSSPERDGAIVITGTEAYHAARVLRLHPGMKALVFDDSGRQWKMEVTAAEKGRVEGRIIAEEPAASESGVSITLAAAILKGERMEFLLQKGTELGVKFFMPLITSRTVVRLSPSEYDSKAQRWQKVVMEATKQCGRSFIPKVFLPERIDSFAPRAGAYDHVLLCWEKEAGISLKRSLPHPGVKPEKILILTGPEGGWAASEVDFFRRYGAKTVSLGPRILRAETAGIVLISALLFHLQEI